MVFMGLFVIACAWGLTHFQPSTEGIEDFPVASGDTLGLYVAEGPLPFATIREEVVNEGLFEPWIDPREAITGGTRIQAWLRLPLTNPSSEPKDYVLQVDYQWIRLALFYAPDGEGGYTVEEQGNLPGRPAGSRTLGPAFRFTLGPNASEVFFLKLQDAHRLQPSLTLWDDPLAFDRHSIGVDRFIHGYLGLMLGLLVANLCVFIAFRHKDLVYYLLFLGASSLLHGVNFNLFTIYRADWVRRDFILIDPAVDFFRFDGLLLLTSGLLLLFASEFLQIKQLSERLNRGVRGFACLLLGLGPLVMFGPAHLAGDSLRFPVAVLWSLSNLLALALGFYALLRKQPQARFFIPALLLLVIVASRFNWNTLTHQLVMTEVLQQWVYASSMEMIIFSVGLIDRFLQLVKEKQDAQAAALGEARSHADLQQRYNAELTATVERQTRDLSQTLDQKNRLLTYLAHDMRTPLHGVVSLASMLARSPHEVTPESVRRYATEIEGNARGVSELMENLLSWARLQTGEFHLQNQEYLVDDLFEATLRTVRTQASLKEVKIILEAPSQCFVLCDFTAIVTVLRNLLSNAIKFSPSGSQVTLQVRAESKHIRLAVEDQGPGLEPAQMSQLAAGKPLLSKRGSAGESGAGLGLGICRDLLRLQQSDLKVTPREGHGARFYFHLPKA